MRKILIPSLLALALTALAWPPAQAYPQQRADDPGSVAAGSPVAAPSGVASLSKEAITALTAALQDERRAETIYGAVSADFGEALPFAHTREAEARHAAALEAIFLRSGLAVPPPIEETAPRYESLLAACTAAAQSERDNVALYDRLLALDLPADVLAVAERNRLASLERHLPAYQRCIDGGGTYTPPAGHGRQGHGKGMGMGPGAGRGPGAEGQAGGQGRGGCCSQCPRRSGSAG